jgi:hypothetical protein
MPVIAVPVHVPGVAQPNVASSCPGKAWATLAAVMRPNAAQNPRSDRLVFLSLLDSFISVSNRHLPNGEIRGSTQCTFRQRLPNHTPETTGTLVAKRRSGTDR